MIEHTVKDEWEPEFANVNKRDCDNRIETCVSYDGWREVISCVLESSKSFEELNVAEVGCGTGTFSLSLALMGASVTLVDFNSNVLERAAKIFGLYDRKPNLVQADCLKKPGEELVGRFDLVISGGLGEHFVGVNRDKCIDFHRQLLKADGFVYFSVPNKNSFFYWILRIFRQLTGTWNLSLEVPFTKNELLKKAKENGFSSYYVLGNASLIRDAKVYSRGLVSAAFEVMPDGFTSLVRKIVSLNKTKSVFLDNESAAKDMKTFCIDMKNKVIRGKKRILAAQFSAGIILFAKK